MVVGSTPARAVVAVATAVVLGGCSAAVTDAAPEPPPASSPASAATGTWTALSPMPVAMAEVGVTALDGQFFLVGGTEQVEGGEPVYDSRRVMTYDPARATWQARADLPMGLSHVGVAALGGKVYAVGGFTDIVHMNPQPVAYEYDPTTDAWTPLPELSTPRGSVAAVAAGGKLHVLGGRQADEILPIPLPPGSPELFQTRGTVTTHQVYDPAAGTWSDAAPLPGEGRDHVGVAVLDDRIHVVGGRIADTDDNLARHDVYDPATGTWSSAAPLPVPRSAGAATVVDGRLVYAGGECKPGGQGGTPNAYSDVTAYDPATDTWATMIPLPSARHGFGAATIDGTAYFAAGAPVCGGGGSSELLEFELGA
jgi:N-acetylneuraminic acid mutarotase